jgi:hypothetical protein
MTCKNDWQRSKDTEDAKRKGTRSGGVSRSQYERQNRAVTFRDQRKLSCVAPEPSVHGPPARYFARLHSRQADGRTEYPEEVEPLVAKKAKSSLYTSIPEGNAGGFRCCYPNPKAHYGCP